MKSSRFALTALALAASSLMHRTDAEPMTRRGLFITDGNDDNAGGGGDPAAAGVNTDPAPGADATVQVAGEGTNTAGNPEGGDKVEGAVVAEGDGGGTPEGGDKVADPASGTDQAAGGEGGNKAADA